MIRCEECQRILVRTARERALSARSDHRSVVIEADGGSRGNPGPAAYGAVLKDADTGEVIAEDGSTIGVATNNVAEYSGLIAGLRLAEEFAPGADIEVRMDSKLVVEQMSGRWKIKHPDMRPLAAEATRLAPFGTTYTWVPREQNKHADRLANEALDGERLGVVELAGDAGEDAGLADRGDREPRAADPPPPGPTAAGRRRVAADHAGAGPARRHAAHGREAVLAAAWPAPTPGSPTRAATRSGPPPTGWRRWPSRSTR